MVITLFAIIGAQIHAGVGYWICFGLYCAYRLASAIKETIEEKGW